MKKTLSKLSSILLSGMMLMSVGITAFATETDTATYARFCADGEGFNSISMTQLAVEGPATIVEDEEGGTVSVTLNLDGFRATRMGITGDGYLKSMNIDGQTFTAEYGNDTDGDGYNNGTIDIEISASKYVADSTTIYTDVSVEADLTVLSGSFTVPMSSDADLYFSTSVPVYSAS